MGSSTQRQIFDRSTEAFNQHDIGAFQAALAQDVTCTAPGNLRFEGPEAVASFYRRWIEGFPDAHVDLRAVHPIDDGFIEEGTFSGTHQGVLQTPDGDLPPTGRTVSAPYVQVVRIRGDQISSFELLYDRLDLLEQLGLFGTGAGESRAGDDTISSMMPM